MGVSIVTSVSETGGCKTTTFSGWGAQTYADRCYNELVNTSHTIYAVHIELCNSLYDVRYEFIRSNIEKVVP